MTGLPTNLFTMTKLPFAKFTMVSFIIIALSIVISGIITYQNSRLYQDTTRQVEHAQRVLKASEDVLSSLKDIETAARGFIITGDSAFLNPLTQGRGTIHQHLINLQVLTQDNPTQKKKVDSLRTFAQQRAALSIDNVRMRAQEGFKRAMEVVITRSGKYLMDDVRRLTADLQASENAVLAQRKLLNMQTIKNFNRMFFVLLATIVVLLVITIVSIGNNLHAAKSQRDQVEVFNKLLVQKVEEKTAELSGIFERITDAFIALDKNFCYTYVNEKTGLLINKDPKALIGKCVWDIFPDAVGSKTYNTFKRAMHDQQYICETDYYAPLDIWQENHVYPSKDGLSVFIRDVTEKKRSEAERENLVEVIQKSLNEIYIFSPTTYQFEYANEGALKNSGFTLEQLTGMQPAHLKPAFSQESFAELVTPLLSKQKEKIVFETVHKRADGSEYHVEEHLQFIDRGKPVFISVVLDIDERKEHEQELNVLNEQLRGRAAELQATNSELEKFAYIASHDLQEPLRMVSSFLQLLEKQYKEKLDDNARAYIQFAVDGAARMKRLILDLLIYSRAGSSSEEFELTDLNEVGAEVHETFLPSLKESGGELVIHSLPTVQAVRSQMMQLFQNLVSNAIKYRQADVPPKVEITCKDTGQGWRISVTDNGIGIEAKYFEKVFVIFQRLHNNSQFTGTGIGLAICKKIVERHGGQIKVESTLGRGSSFIINFTRTNSIPIHES